MSRRVIRYVGRKAGHHPVIALTVAGLLTILAAWTAYNRLTIEMDVAALLPKDSEVYKETSRADWLFGLGNYDFMLCSLELKGEEGDPEFLKEIKPEVEEALDDQRYFSRRADRARARELEGLQGNEAALVALLTDDDFDQIEERVLPGGIDHAVAEIAATLGDKPGTVTLAQLQRDPLGIEEMLQSHTTFVAGPLKGSYSEGYYLSDDGKMLLVLLWPIEPSTNLVYARDLMLFVNQTREALYKRNPGWRDRVDIGFVGPHVENAEGTADVRQDIFLSSIVSFIAVCLLFILAFRQPEALLYVAIPLFVGVIWTLGLTSLFIPRITQVTLTFAAILIGLGIDFSIHLYNRFQEDMRLGRDASQALSSAIMNTGPSIVAGAITTGFAFFGMALTRFQGFRELGLFGGIGIIMSLIAVATILPPLIMIFSAKPRIARGPLATLGLKKITFTVQSYPRMAVAAGLCLLAFLGLHATEARFDADFQTLRQPSDHYTELLDRLESHFAIPTNQVLVIVEGRTPDEALAANDHVFENIQAMRELYDLISVDSLRNIYPAPETQIDSIERFLSLPKDNIIQTLRDLNEATPEIPQDFFQPFIDRLEDIWAVCQERVRTDDHPIGLDRTEDRVFLNVAFTFMQHDSEKNVYSVVTRVYPPPTQEWTENVPQLFEDNLADGLDQQPTVLGNAILSRELQNFIIRDLTIIVLVVFFAVSLYLIFYFGSIVRAALAIVPVLFALMSMLGVMQMLGMELNYLNVIAIPMIVGIGVDSAIHLLGRFYEDDSRNMRLAIEKTGRAIVITSLTTIFGFGALSVASFSGIREIGILSIIGTLGTLFAALILLPSILKLMDPQYTFKGGPGDEIG